MSWSEGQRHDYQLLNRGGDGCQGVNERFLRLSDLQHHGRLNVVYKCIQKASTWGIHIVALNTYFPVLDRILLKLSILNDCDLNRDQTWEGLKLTAMVGDRSLSKSKTLSNKEMKLICMNMRF